MSKFEKHRMSAALRADLEEIARMCNDYMPHQAGDELEAILGYPVGDFSAPLTAEDAEDAKEGQDG